MKAVLSRAALGAACVVLGAALGACSDDDVRTAVRGEGDLGWGGTLVWALGGPVDDVDPLAADSPAEQLVVRQVYEPLVARYDGPFGEAVRVPGLALSVRSRAGGARWDVRLRAGVRFHDGSPLNGAAVLANVRRWQASEAGRALLPGLVAADSPRPDVVRLFFSEPRDDVGERLGAVQLGIVAPSVLRARGGAARLGVPLASGSGPFELRERSGDRLLLAHNTEWWGSERDLGPALDQIEFRVVESADARVRALRAGEVRVAGGLDRTQARAAASDPLIAAAPQAGGSWIAYERSLRGLGRGDEVPALAGVWIAALD